MSRKSGGRSAPSASVHGPQASRPSRAARRVVAGASNPELNVPPSPAEHLGLIGPGEVARFVGILDEIISGAAREIAAHESIKPESRPPAGERISGRDWAAGARNEEWSLDAARKRLHLARLRAERRIVAAGKYWSVTGLPPGRSIDELQEAYLPAVLFQLPETRTVAGKKVHLVVAVLPDATVDVARAVAQHRTARRQYWKRIVVLFNARPPAIRKSLLQQWMRHGAKSESSSRKDRSSVASFFKRNPVFAAIPRRLVGVDMERARLAIR